MVDDILFSNNSNILVVDDETALLSEAREAFHVRCHYRRAYCDGFEIKEEWIEEIVPFSNLTLNVEGQQAFKVDFSGDEKRLGTVLENVMRTEFFQLFEADWPFADLGSPLHIRWMSLQDALSQRGIYFPGNYPQADTEYRALVIILRSMELGHPVIWNDPTLVALVHRIFNNYKKHVFPMVEAIKTFNRKDDLLKSDDSKKWNAKRPLIKKALDEFERGYIPDSGTIPLIKFLYPEIGRAVERYIDSYFAMTTS